MYLRKNRGRKITEKQHFITKWKPKREVKRKGIKEDLEVQEELGERYREITNIDSWKMTQ